MNKKNTDLPGFNFTGDITIFGPMFDIHDNQNVYINGTRDGRRRTEDAPSPKSSVLSQRGPRAASEKPMTLKYYHHGNNGLLMKQRKRVDIVFRKFNEWKWIDDETAAEDFDALFEGEPRHCNITWTGNATVLTILLQELLKQDYIEKQTGCSAKSMVAQQFGKTANWNRSRMDGEAEDRIRLTLLILDVRNPLPEPRRGGNEEGPDLRDAALKAIYAGQLRVTKGV